MSIQFQLSDVPAGLEVVIGKIQKAFSDRNYRLWLECFDYKDEMSLAAEKDWFIGYIINKNLTGVKIDWLSICLLKETMMYRISCGVTFCYTYYNDHNEWHEYYINRNEKSGQWRIYIIQKKRQAFKDIIEDVTPYRFIKMNAVYPALDWDNKVLLHRLSTIEDRGQISLYARAISRGIRYRQSQPIIECASLRANMLSPYIAKLVVEYYDSDQKRFAAKIYNAVRDSILLSIERSDRDNSWASKFQASWQGIDELMETNVQNGKLTCSCSSYMSYLHSAFRLGGFKCDDVLQIRLKTQDILILYIKDMPFLIDTERMVPVTERVLFHYTKASVIYTDEWVWTEEGLTNLSIERRKKIQQRMEMIHFLQFPFYVNSEINAPSQAVPLNLCPVSFDFMKYHRALLTLSFQNYCLQPNSIDAWTLYAYQTLLVKKPEVYMNWSIQSKLVRQRVSELQTKKDIIDTLAKINDNSIFIEPHRIMTVDQVLKAGCGNHVSKALLAAVFFKALMGCEAAVLLTVKKSYCVICTGKEIKCMEMPTGKEITEIRGCPLLIFNEKSSLWIEAEEEKDFSLKKIILKLKQKVLA